MNSSEWKNTEYYKYYNHKHDSMYKFLKLNTYSPLQNFQDFPLKTSNQFMSREEYFNYIKDYASHFDLYKNIKLNTFVTSIRLYKNIPQEEKEKLGIGNFTKKFIIEYCSNYEENRLDIKNKYYMEFDKVIVCNGHFTVPNIPKIKNSEIFEGKIMHSHNFRRPDSAEFLNKKILIIGINVSGIDLLVQFISNPILSHGIDIDKIYMAGNTKYLEKSEDFSEYYKNEKIILKKGRIREFKTDGVIFEDKSEAIIDIVIYCTGYKYSIPFIKEEEGLIFNTDGNIIWPLYLDIFCANEPDLALIGLFQGTFFINTTVQKQIELIKNVFLRRISLPTNDLMLLAVKNKMDKYLKTFGSYYKYHNVLIDSHLYYDELEKHIGCNNEFYKTRIKIFEDIIQIFMKFWLSGNVIQLFRFNFNDLIKKQNQLPKM